MKGSRQLVAKLMRTQNIQIVIKKKFKIKTDTSHKYPVGENILIREFTVSNQNAVRVSDITYIRIIPAW